MNGRRDPGPRRRMRTVLILYYGGLALLLSGAVALVATPLGAALLAVGGAAMIFAAGLSYRVRCPRCGSWLCRGMRLPGPPPSFCPRCGAEVK